MAAKNVAAAEEVIETETLKDLVRSMKELAESQQIGRQKSVLEVKPDTPWDNAANPRTSKLRGEVYCNGVEVNPEFINEEETVLFNQLKSGTYNHKKWTVRRSRDGNLEFWYPNKTVEQRMEIKDVARNLTEMLKLIVMEQEAQLAKKKAGQFDDDEDY